MAVLNDENGEPQYGKLVTVDMFTGEADRDRLDHERHDAPRPATAKCRRCWPSATTVRSMSSTPTRNTYLYSFRLTEDGKIGELTKVGKTGFKANYLQSMAF